MDFADYVQNISFRFLRPGQPRPKGFRALNMLMRGVGAWLEPRGVIVVSIAPGWTRTELGGPNAFNSIEDAVTGVRGVMDRLTLDDTGTYWNYDGERLPW